MLKLPLNPKQTNKISSHVSFTFDLLDTQLIPGLGQVIFGLAGGYSYIVCVEQIILIIVIIAVCYQENRKKKGQRKTVVNVHIEYGRENGCHGQH